MIYKAWGTKDNQRENSATLKDRDAGAGIVSRKLVVEKYSQKSLRLTSSPQDLLLAQLWNDEAPADRRPWKHGNSAEKTETSATRRALSFLNGLVQG